VEAKPLGMRADGGLGSRRSKAFGSSPAAPQTEGQSDYRYHATGARTTQIYLRRPITNAERPPNAAHVTMRRLPLSQVGGASGRGSTSRGTISRPAAPKPSARASSAALTWFARRQRRRRHPHGGLRVREDALDESLPGGA